MKRELGVRKTFYENVFTYFGPPKPFKQESVKKHPRTRESTYTKLTLNV